MRFSWNAVLTHGMVAPRIVALAEGIFAKPCLEMLLLNSTIFERGAVDWAGIAMLGYSDV